MSGSSYGHVMHARMSRLSCAVDTVHLPAAALPYITALRFELSVRYLGTDLILKPAFLNMGVGRVAGPLTFVHTGEL